MSRRARAARAQQAAPLRGQDRKAKRRRAAALQKGKSPTLTKRAWGTRKGQPLGGAARLTGGNGRSPSMRSGPHSAETKAKAEADSSSRWLVGMTARITKAKSPTLIKRAWGTRKGQPWTGPRAESNNAKAHRLRPVPRHASRCHGMRACATACGVYSQVSSAHGLRCVCVKCV